MKSVGIDIGSRTIKSVVMSENGILEWDIADAVSRPARIAGEMLARYAGVPVVATGYGRQLLQKQGVPAVTEIKACARGVRHLYDDARGIIDVGGQDLKVICLDKKGKVAKFEMNDRCAAGTGKFLEIMAEKLGFDIADFGDAALRGRDTITISSLCTVFAESEVIGLLNRDEPIDIACAVHRSAVAKITSMYKRICSTPDLPVYLVGGGALNKAVAKLLEKELQSVVKVAGNPQIVVAVGASVIASERRVSIRPLRNSGMCSVTGSSIERIKPSSSAQPN
ncbi:MAG: acyl-CoA dehydratase activase [Chitinivibrionales bacterium]